MRSSAFIAASLLSLSLGLLVGFPLVIVGCWLAATGGRLRPRAGARGDDLPALPEPVATD